MKNEKSHYMYPLLLLLFGILFSVLSAYFSINSDGDWFARSGAVLSFISVVVQFLLSNRKKDKIEQLIYSNIGLKKSSSN
ncbi:hypothetical protein CW751_02575 [Brumimicrobium salinarum]|uniref:Uncharacterized protein n=1 Tax=Brumimicrobium salinarum TaxID=2058658 RepID=A0A2I0R6M6_9FLAO|nr:hypothetical protein [Brumimicrobium salinarum]PKR82236.1 hypothetical protein CW751_02575 [Brumimicrobium salinarum]